MNQSAIFSTLIALGVLLMTACTSSSVIDDPTASADEVPIVLGSSVTKAIVGADKAGMENFSVWGWCHPTQATSPSVNVFQATEVDPYGAYSGLRYWADGQTYNFYAVHPARLAQQVDCTATGTLLLKDFDTSLHQGTDAVDIMTATANRTYVHTPGVTPAPVALRFNHELARVSFEVRNLDPNHLVTIQNVRLYGLYYKGTLSKQFTAVEETSQWSQVTTNTMNQQLFENLGPIEIAYNQQAYTNLLGDLLLIPQAFTTYTGAYFDIEYKRSHETTFTTAHVPLSVAAYTVWEKGKHYRYLADITANDQINIMVTVSKWDEKSLNVQWGN